MKQESQMIKAATTSGPVMDVLRNRWSARSFSDREISTAEIDTILEAGTWAFSAFNEQPWRYIVAHRGSDLFQQLWGLLAPGNQLWCDKAAVLLLSLVETHTATGKPNPWGMHDLGAANFALTLQANAMGIYTHVMAGYDKARAVTELELPETVDSVAMIALGYLDDPEKLAEPFKTREVTPRTRKSVGEVVLRRG